MSPEKPISGYAQFELDRCLRMAETLLGELEACVPDRLRVLLDTWRADMLAEQEDRERAAGAKAAEG